MKIVIVALVALCLGLFVFGYLRAHPETWDQLVAQCSQGPATAPAPAQVAVAKVAATPAPNPPPAELAILEKIQLVRHELTIAAYANLAQPPITRAQNILDIQVTQVKRTGCTFKIKYHGGWAQPDYEYLGPFDTSDISCLELRWYKSEQQRSGWEGEILAVTFPRVLLPVGQTKEITLDFDARELRSLTGARRVALVSVQWGKFSGGGALRIWDGEI